MKIIRNLMCCILMVGVMLFTTFVHAEIEPWKQEIQKMIEKLEFEDKKVGGQNIAFLVGFDEGSNVATTKISKEIINKLKESGLSFTVIEEDISGYSLGITNGTEVFKLEFNYFEENHPLLISSDIDISEGDIIGDDIEISAITIDGASVFTNDLNLCLPDGTTTTGIQVGESTADLWTDTGTVTLSATNCELSDDGSLYTYKFKVDKTGTWNVTMQGETSNGNLQIFNASGPGANQPANDWGFTEENSLESNFENKILSMDNLYKVSFRAEDVEAGRITISYGYLHAGINSGFYEMTPDPNLEEKPPFEVIEEIIAGLVLSIAKLLNWLISIVMGETITMDNIIFNKYPEVNINFFEPPTGGFTETMVALRDSINACYSFFRNIAIVGYLVILVYIGIKILLNSTTPDKKASYKSTFWYWVSGIIILFFFPYVMRNAIVLNEALVTEIATMGGASTWENRRPATLNQELNKGFLHTDFDKVINYSSGSDYMSKVGAIANDTMKLGFAIAYLVMTWQLIMMLVYYYKRLFIVAFLIIVFPLIAFTYVWDKLNDGKSQALSSWMKEYFVSIFVQTFHAIVYVFICRTIYATFDTGAMDFILLIIVSSFMFTGEDILKQIFGGGGTIALGSVAQTGAKIAITTNLVTRVGKRVIHNVAGKDGFVRGNITSFNNYRKYRILEKKDKNGVTNFQKLAENPTVKARVATLLPSQGPITKNIQETAEMVDTFNHLDVKSPEDVAKALKAYERLMKARSGLGPNAMTEQEKKQFDEIMKHCTIGPHQIDGLNKAMFAATVAYGANNNAKKEIDTIRQNLRVEVEQVFNVKNKDGKVNSQNQAVANKMLNAALINARKDGISGVTRKDVAKAYEDKVQETRDLYDSIKFVTKNPGTKNEMMIVRQRREVRVEELTQMYIDANGGKKLNARELARVRRSAKNFAVLEGLDKKEVSAHEAANAMQGLGRNREIDEAMLRLSKVKGDISQLEYVLAKKIKSENPGPDGRQFRHSSNKNYGGKKFKGKASKNKNSGNAGARVDATTWADRTVRIYEAKAAGRDNKEHFEELAGERMGAFEYNGRRKSSSGYRSERRSSAEYKGGGRSFAEYSDERISSTEYSGERAEENVSRKAENFNDSGRRAGTNNSRGARRVEKMNVEKSSSTNKRYNIKGVFTRAGTPSIDLIEKGSRGAGNGTNTNYKNPVIMDNDESVINESKQDLEGFTDDSGNIIRKTSRTTRKTATDKAIEKNPYFSILDIIGGAQKTSRTGGIANINDMLDNASRSDVVLGVVDSKMDDVRSQNQNNIINSQEFADLVIKEEEFEIGRLKRAFREQVLEIKSPEYEKPTYNGYTEKEIKQLKKAEIANMISRTGSAFTDIAITPTATVAGVAIGAALTNDGMPIEEGIAGALTGATFSEKFSEGLLPKLTHQDDRTKAQSSIEKKVKKRLKNDESARLKARDAMNEAADNNKDIVAKTLGISMVTADLYMTVDNKLSATVHVIAENAQYVYISEVPVMPSSGWLPYQELVNYEFKDNDTKKTHTLFVYVRDDSSNIRSTRISNLRFN